VPSIAELAINLNLTEAVRMVRGDDDVPPLGQALAMPEGVTWHASLFVQVRSHIGFILRQFDGTVVASGYSPYGGMFYVEKNTAKGGRVTVFSYA
jgi:hypothetical protein